MECEGLESARLLATNAHNECIKLLALANLFATASNARFRRLGYSESVDLWEAYRYYREQADYARILCDVQNSEVERIVKGLI